MSDDLLRRLEREARADPQAASRLAHALRRAGRAADGVAALLARADDLAIRREAARAARDPAPLRGPPRLRWLRALDGRDHSTGMLASPLGVVVPTTWRTVVLDAESGSPRAELPAGAPLLADEVVLVFTSGLELLAFDLWTGEGLHRTRVIGTGSEAAFGEGLFATARRGEVVAYRLEDPRQRPRLAWRARLDETTPRVRAVGEGVVVAELRSRGVVVVLDAADGRERARLDGELLALAGGHVVVARGWEGVAGAAVGGDGRWTRPDALVGPVGGRAHGLLVPLRGPPPTRWALLDPASGATTATVDARGASDAVAAAGVLHLAIGGEVWALDLAVGGAARWVWRPRRTRSSVGPVVPLPGRVVVRVGLRAVACLEDGA